MMLDISNFYIILLILTITFISLSIFNLFGLLIFMELFWVCYFLILVLYSQITLCYIFFTLSLYLFSLATAETTIGLLLVFFQNNFLKKQFSLKPNQNFFFSKYYQKNFNAKIK